MSLFSGVLLNSPRFQDRRCAPVAAGRHLRAALSTAGVSSRRHSASNAVGAALFALSLLAAPTDAFGAETEDASPSTSLIAPERRGGFAYGVAAPEAFGAALGGFAGASLAMGYVGAAPYALDLSLAPIGLSIAGGAHRATGLARAHVSYDAEAFAIGPMIGAVFHLGYARPAFGAGARLGWRDGLNLQVSASAAVDEVSGPYPVGESPPPPDHRLQFGHLDVRIEAPVSQRGTLVAWLGAVDLHVRAAAGYRARVSGDGGSGSTFIEGRLGFGVTDVTFAAEPGCDCQELASGPLARLAIERRF